jgi:hypothetical protein
MKDFRNSLCLVAAMMAIVLGACPSNQPAPAPPGSSAGGQGGVDAGVDAGVDTGPTVDGLAVDSARTSSKG